MKNKEVAEFVVYIINEIANLTEHPTASVYQALSDTDCIKNYLIPYYDILHTISSQRVAEDVLNYLQLRGKVI